jgi:histidinol dehydrogenase
VLNDAIFLQRSLAWDEVIMVATVTKWRIKSTQCWRFIYRADRYLLLVVPVVAALAYGTERFPVERTTDRAIRRCCYKVFGQVGIDMIAGPLKSFVYAEGEAADVPLAMDLLSQAGVIELSAAIFVTNNSCLKPGAAVAIETESFSRISLIRRSLQNRGALSLVRYRRFSIV